jgi:hypothetical protein
MFIDDHTVGNVFGILQIRPYNRLKIITHIPDPQYTHLASFVQLHISALLSFVFNHGTILGQDNIL